MAMKDFKSIQVAPGTEDETVRLWMSFGWELKNKQRVKTQDVQKYTGQSVDHSTSYYETTRGVDFFELSFERDQSRPNYAELVQLEKQYEPCGSGFDVILIDDGAQVKGNAQRSNVAEVLRSHGFDFDESFRLVEKGIATIKKAVTKADAEKLKKDMEDAGAKVMLTETNVRLSVEAKVNIPSWPSYPHLSKEPERLEFFGCLWSILALIGLLFYIVPGVVVIIWRNQKYIEAKKIWDEECAAHEKKLDVYRKEYDVYRKELADCRANYVEQLEIAEKKFQEILEKARSLV